MSSACIFCGSARASRLPQWQEVPPNDYSLAGCPECGTAFLDPVPSEEELIGFYGESYYGAGSGKFAGPVEFLVRLSRRLRARAVMRLIPAGRSVLDVGCGRGLMLAELGRCGYRVMGVELETKAAERASAALGSPVLHDLEAVRAACEQPFDAITFWHSLEHFRDPGQAFATACDMLAVSGVMVLALPNFGSLQRRLSGRDWLHLDIPRHVSQFDTPALARHLARHGFEIIRHDHFSREYNVIDSLCHLYARLGFGPQFPFECLKGLRHVVAQAGGVARLAVGALLASVLLPGALAFSELCSLVGSGSTTTLYLRKRA